MPLQKPNLNKPAFKIFPIEGTMIGLSACPICGHEIFESEFRDELSKIEYSISGMCQRCQDAVFTEGDDEE